MIYQAYQTLADLTDPFKLLAQQSAALLESPWFKHPQFDLPWLNKLTGSLDSYSRTRLSHKRPPFNIPFIKSGEERIKIHEEVIHRTAFCSLLRFAKEGVQGQPKVLLVAPMSGHFATLLRGTIKTLLRDHDVYVTDWHNARDIPLWEGRFDLDAYTRHVIDHLAAIGPGSHVVAVCQPTVATLAAVSVMAERNHPAQPASMTLMAGPLDTRINPTAVNHLAKSKPIEWFEKNMIATVPLRYAGAFRRVYPGFVQLSAFMSMNLERHVQSFKDMATHHANGEHDKSKAIKDFYEEYFAMSDLPAEFFIETVATVFQEHALPLGKLCYEGNPVSPAAIKRTALLTIEGEKDDICSIGQTVSAHDMCSSIRPYMKQHHVQTGAGHYGVFNGRRWDNEIYPILRDFVFSHQT
ncbi:polyhydroxyalkanoate depolymerase [Ampullimonas aquatilis]|uniref:polyhydroxyalkanoate depolymerase n=1 Tax=Ampullimonas aquatilis TaxID=1341549 RepID=UPI003C768AEC